MTQKTSINDDATSANAVYLREGDQVGFTIPVSGVVTGISSVTLAMYKEGATVDVGSTYWSTTACTISGVNTVVTSTTQNLKAGNWIVSVSGTVDGLVQNIITLPIIVKRKGER